LILIQKNYIGFNIMENYISFDDNNSNINNKACFIVVASLSFLMGFLVNNGINMLIYKSNSTNC